LQTPSQFIQIIIVIESVIIIIIEIIGLLVDRHLRTHEAILLQIEPQR